MKPCCGTVPCWLCAWRFRFLLWVRVTTKNQRARRRHTRAHRRMQRHNSTQRRSTLLLPVTKIRRTRRRAVTMPPADTRLRPATLQPATVRERRQDTRRTATVRGQQERRVTRQPAIVRGRRDTQGRQIIVREPPVRLDGRAMGPMPNRLAA